MTTPAPRGHSHRGPPDDHARKWDALSFDGANAAQPSLPPIPGFQLVGTGSSFSLDATRGIAQQKFTYQFAPSQAGDFTIPPFQFQLGGETLTTQPIQIKVVKPGDAVAAQSAAMPAAFVKLVTPKTQLYVGEISELEVQVYFRKAGSPNIRRCQPTRASRWAWLAGRDPREHQQPAITSHLQAADHSGESGRADSVHTVPFRAGQNAPSRFFFGRPEREVRMVTEKLTVQALPVPDKTCRRPLRAVGSLRCMTAAPTNWQRRSITVQVQIRGRGALDNVQLPPQPDWKNSKRPATSRTRAPMRTILPGRRCSEQVVVPERADRAAAVAFSFFDQTSRRSALTGPAIPLSVSAAAGGGGAAQSPQLHQCRAGPARVRPGAYQAAGHRHAANTVACSARLLGLRSCRPRWLGLLLFANAANV
jgi:hypothetical protein